MSRFYIIFLLATIYLMSPFAAHAKVNIFACEPEWKSLSKEIGGDYVESFSATSSLQNPHYIRAKPSLIAKIRKADLLICSGSDLEVGWLPVLLTKGNRNIQMGKIGYFMASDFVKRIEQSEILDRSMGDIHPQGNPHIHLNPYNILVVAKELNDRLQRIDPNNAQNYQTNYDDFVNRWNKAIINWERKARKLQGIKVIPHHKSFSYLIDWLKMDEIATLESKPGIAPTSKHLEDLLILSRRDRIGFIIRTPFDPQDASNWLAKKTNIKELILPYTVGGEQNNDLFSLFDNTISLLIKVTK